MMDRVQGNNTWSTPHEKNSCHVWCHSIKWFSKKRHLYVFPLQSYVKARLAYKKRGQSAKWNQRSYWCFFVWLNYLCLLNQVGFSKFNLKFWNSYPKICTKPNTNIIKTKVLILVYYYRGLMNSRIFVWFPWHSHKIGRR